MCAMRAMRAVRAVQADGAHAAVRVYSEQPGGAAGRGLPLPHADRAVPGGPAA